MNALAIVRLVNTGILVWDNVAPLVERAMETGEDVSMADLESASGQLGEDLIALAAAIERARARGR